MHLISDSPDRLLMHLGKPMASFSGVVPNYVKAHVMTEVRGREGGQAEKGVTSQSASLMAGRLVTV